MMEQINKIRSKVNVKILYSIMIYIFAFLGTYFIKYIINFKDEITYTNSIIGIVIFISFVYLLKKSYIKENMPKIKNAFILGIILSAFLVIGNSIKTYHSVELKDISIYFAIIFISIIMTAGIVQLHNFFEKYEEKDEKEEKKYNITQENKFIIITLIILICWLPFFLAAYPGYFTYDANTQYNQLNRLNGENLTDLHPIVHTIILASIVTSGQLITGDANIGIAIYTIIQMIIVAGCLAYTIIFLEKFKVSKTIRIIAIIYYSLFPVVIMFAMCATKDTVFSAMLLMSIMISIEALMDKEKFINSKWLQARFIIITFSAIIFRNNAIYAYIPFLIIFAILLKKKKIFISFAIIAILYGIYTGPIYTILRIPNHYQKKSEAFSVPLQQIARVYNYNYESLTDEELEMIYKYTTEEQLKSYRPEIADPVKGGVDIKTDIGYANFLKTWLSIGIKNMRNIYRFISRKHTRILVPRYNYRWI